MLRKLPSTASRSPLLRSRFVVVSILVHLGLLAAVLLGDGAERSGQPSATAVPERPYVDVQGVPGRSAGVAGSSGGGADSVGGFAPLWAEIPPQQRGQIVAVQVTSPSGESATQMTKQVRGPFPTVLRVGQSYAVRLRYRVGRDEARSQGSLSPVRHAWMMGDGFRIEPRDAPMQVADSARHLVWGWTVTPRVEGVQPLRVAVEGVAQQDGRHRVVGLDQLHYRVPVEREPRPWLLDRIDRSPLTGLVLLFALTLGARWLYVRWRSRRG